MMEELISYFSGGWNSFFESSVKNPSYSKAFNAQINERTGGIKPRDAFRYINIEWKNSSQKKIFEEGAVQSSIFFLNESKKSCCLVAVSGYIFYLEINSSKQCFADVLDIRQRSRYSSNVFFTKTSKGIIINDGENLPILYGYSGLITESDPYSNPPQIEAGLQGAFVQNRFFYISPDRRNILFSSYENPLSLEEPLLFNIRGFRAPSNEEITSIGNYSHSLRSGFQRDTLIFSTKRGIYVVDVRGAIVTDGSSEAWKVTEIVGGIGNYCPNFFVSVDNNIYFRSRERGICTLNNSLSQESRSDGFTSQSYEIDDFVNNIDISLLSKCWAFSAKDRIYCSVSPFIKERRDGTISLCWRGMIVKRKYAVTAPSNYTNRGEGIWESCYTGLNFVSSFYMDDGDVEGVVHISCDNDGINRLYLESSLNSIEQGDVSHVGEKEIEWFFNSHRMSFGSSIYTKKIKTILVSIPKYLGNVSFLLQGKDSDTIPYNTLGDFKLEAKVKETSSKSFWGFKKGDFGSNYQKELTFTDTCKVGSFVHFTARINVKGYAEIQSILFNSQPHKKPNEINCMESSFILRKKRTPEYSYHIVD